MAAPDFSKPTIDTLARRARFQCSNPDCNAQTVGPNSDPEKATTIGEAAPLRRRIQEIEARVEGVQKEIGQIDKKLANPSLYARNPADAAFLARNRSDAARKLATAEDEWLVATTELEERMAENQGQALLIPTL